MRIFYYSKKNLRLKEVNKRLLFIILFSPFVLLFVTSISLVQQLYFSSSSSLKNENQKLKENLKILRLKFADINENLSKLYNKEKELRVAANLSLSNYSEYGIGGSEDRLFDENMDDEVELKKINQLTDKLSNEISFQLESFKEIENKIKENKILMSSIPAIIPMHGSFAEMGFGMRFHPILHRWRFHEGIDILGNVGDLIFSSGNGKVTYAGWRGGYGLCIEIDHGFGYTTVYAHLSKTYVKIGQEVKRYQKIGECGNTGLSVGPHLHYEVIFNGEKQDPMNYFLN